MVSGGDVLVGEAAEAGIASPDPTTPAPRSASGEIAYRLPRVNWTTRGPRRTLQQCPAASKRCPIAGTSRIEETGFQPATARSAAGRAGSLGTSGLLSRRLRFAELAVFPRIGPRIGPRGRSAGTRDVGREERQAQTGVISASAHGRSSPVGLVLQVLKRVLRFADD